MTPRDLMICWKCNKPLKEQSPKVGFRDYCPYCSSDLHVCKNCKFYSPGKPNDCQVPDTEIISDREKGNLCEDFKPKLGEEKSSSSKAEEIFGKDSIPVKKKFNDLFKD